MATKITSVGDGRLHFTISATLTWWLTYANPRILACVTGKTFCVDFLVIPCFIDLAQGPTGSELSAWVSFATALSICVCAKSRLDVLWDYPCIPSWFWLVVSVLIPEKDHTFCGFLSTVCRIFVTYDYTKRTLEHPQCGYRSWLLKILSRTRSYWRIIVYQLATMKEVSIDVKSFSNFSSADSLGGAYRAEATDRWTASSGITFKFLHSLTSQLRGWSMIMMFEVRVIYKLEVPKRVDGQTGDVLEQCMTTSVRAAGVKSKKEIPCTEKKPQLKKWEVYYKQFAKAKLLQCNSSVDDEVFDLVDLRKVKSEGITWPDDWCSPSTRTNRVTSSRQEARMGMERGLPRQTEGTSTDRFLLLPQRVGSRMNCQTASQREVGTYVTSDLKTAISLMDSLLDVSRDVPCVTCHHKQVILRYTAAKIEEKTCLWHEWYPSTLEERFGHSTV